MKRKASSELGRWYASPDRKPLIIRGARQVGKTWLIQDFASGRAAGSVYINFEDDKQLRDIFEQDFNMERILERISIQKTRTFRPTR